MSRSYYTPAEFEYALNQALEYSDEYVWTYSLGCSWWEGGAKEPGDVIPQAYRDALLAAKRPHPYIPVLRNLDAHVALRPGSALPPRKLSQPVRGYAEADEFQTYDEEVTFGALWTEYRFLADLPHLWRFRIDPYDTGVKEGWFGPVVNERNWLWITSELPWDNQGYRLYDGYGWYRQEFDAPALPDDTKVFLAFGGVAHGAEVYLNGTKGRRTQHGQLTLGEPQVARHVLPDRRQRLAQERPREPAGRPRRRLRHVRWRNLETRQADRQEMRSSASRRYRFSR